MSHHLTPRFSALRPLALAVALCCTVAAPAHADDRAELERLRGTTQNLIKALVDAGLLTQDKAEQLLRQAEQATPPVNSPAPAPAPTDAAPADGKAARPNVIRVPYVPETVRNQIRDEIRQDVLNQARTERWGNPNTLPSWANRITLEGDVRFRLQSEDWDRRNATAAGLNELASQNDPGYEGPIAWSPDITNTQDRRDRMTLRARFGLTSDLAYGFKTGFRLSTGNTQAVSTSQTLGSPGQFSKYSVFLDRAWIQWTPYIPDVAAYVGRFASPYFGGDLIWPDDLNFDGAAVKGKYAFNDANTAFVNVGAFPLAEFQSSSADSWLYGAQVGGQFKPDAESQFDVGVGLYDFQNIEGRFDPMYRDTATSPLGADKSYLATEYRRGVRQRGNTLIRINQATVNNQAGAGTAAPVWGLASKFRPLTVSAAYTYRGLDELSVRASADFIQNIGFSLSDIRRRAQPGADIDVAKKNRAWQARVQIGTPKQELLGDWSAYVGWRRFERDAWLDAFTDTTWHLGGTNYVGWTLGGAYFVGPRTSLGLRVTSTRNLTDGRTEQVTGVTVPNLSSVRQRIDVLQVELNSRF